MPIADPEFDWVRLDTDEWLKGELISMHNDSMDFESDKFDRLTFDWEDVVELRIVQPRVFRFTDNRIVRGRGLVENGVVQIEQEDGARFEAPQPELVSIVYTQESERHNWRTRIGASFAARQGNTDQQDISANAEISREGLWTRWKNRYVGTFSKLEGNDTVNNHRASTQLDWLLTQRFFVRVPSFEYFKDQFQNIDGRYSPGAGLGYQTIDNGLVEHEISMGFAGQLTTFRDGPLETDAAALFATELSFDLPHDIDLDFRYKLQLVMTDLDKTSHNTQGILSFSVWDPLDLDVGAYWDRIEGPEREDSGNTPKRNDFRLTVGLSLDL